MQLAPAVFKAAVKKLPDVLGRHGVKVLKNDYMLWVLDLKQYNIDLNNVPEPTQEDYTAAENIIESILLQCAGCVMTEHELNLNLADVWYIEEFDKAEYLLRF
jgi:hypothetical protein